MTVPQYLRKCSLLVGQTGGDAIDLSELRIRFTIRRGDYQNPNTAYIRVYNLSDETVSRVQSEFTRVVLQCGYQETFGVIFDGQIMQFRKGRENPTDTYLEIIAGDGDSAYNFSLTAISLAAGINTPNNAIENIIKGLASYGVNKGYVPQYKGNPLPRGAVFFGSTKSVMRKTAQALGAAWSIQDGKFTMIPLTGYIPSGTVPVVNAQTGLIGLPEQTQNGINLRVLINPAIKIGQLIKLDNAAIQQYRYSLAVGDQAVNQQIKNQNRLNDDGLYYVMAVNYSGDTRGNDWYQDIWCLAVDATVPLDVNPYTPAAEPVGPIKVNG